MSRRLARAVRNEYLLAAACLGVLLAIFFSPLVTSDSTFSSVANLQRYYYPWFAADQPLPARLAPQADQATYVHPRQVFVDRALDRDGQFPLWNPLSLGGTPFMAEAGSRLAYPPYVLLTKLFNPVWAHDLYVILHLFVGGMAMFALLKQYRAGFAGALLAAVSWAFASYVMGFVMLEMIAAVVALLPLAVLLVRRGHDHGSTAALLGAGLVLGLLLMGSSVDLALLCFVVVLGYAGLLSLSRLAAGWRTSSLRIRLWTLAQPGLLAAVALAVAAVTLLPFLELQGRSDRLTVPIEMQLEVLSVPFEAFRHVLTPPPVSVDVAKSVYSLNNEQIFVGTLTGVLAFVGFFTRRRGAGLGRALVVVLFLLATGTVVARAVYEVVPFIGSLTGFGKMLFLWDFGVAILGGVGLSVLVEKARVRGARAGLRWVPAVAVVCIAVTATQLLVYGRRVNPPFQRREAAQLFPTTDAVNATRVLLGTGPGRGRAVAVSPLLGNHALVASTAMAVDLPVGNAYEPFTDERVSTLWRVIGGEPEAHALATGTPGTLKQEFPAATVRTDLLARVGVAAVFAPAGDVLGPRWTAAALAPLGVRLAYTGPDGTVFAVPATPRARVVPEAVWVDSEADAMARFTSPTFDPRTQVVLEGERAAAGPAPAQTATVRWVRDNPNDVRLSVTSDQPAWLVLSDSWDPGWRATVNGRGTPIRRADYGFRAVRVPAGTSTVRFTYRPEALVAGVAISSVALAAVAVAVIVDVRRRTGLRRPARRRRLRSEPDAVADGPDAAGQAEGG